jgi:hypothetical protein
VRYAQYVFKKSSPGKPLPDLTYRKPSSPTTPRTNSGTASTSLPKTGKQKSSSNPGRVFSPSLGFLIVILCLCGLAGISYTFDLYNSAGVARATRQVITSPDQDGTPLNLVEATSDQPASQPGTETVCVIIWVEHSSEGLAAKNRSMVWLELVKVQVNGSGMTGRQFYDQVVEKNPHMAADGYVFQEGKTYLLPQCKE